MTKADKAAHENGKKHQKMLAKAVQDHKQTNIANLNIDPVGTFFARYPNFVRDPSKEPRDEYARLREHMGWPSRRKTKKHAQRDQARGSFRVAMTETFHERIGGDENDIEAWVELCKLCGYTDLDGSIDEMRDKKNSNFANFQSLY